MREALTADVERAKGELGELTEEADAAKKNLIAFRGEIEALRSEKIRVLARIANAKTRLRLQEMLWGLSPDADIRALEAVREHANRLVAEANASRGDGELEERLARIRSAEEDALARSQLEELKSTRRASFAPSPVAPLRDPMAAAAGS